MLARLARWIAPLTGKQLQGSRKLKGLKAIITGGDSGVGRAVAIAYAREELMLRSPTPTWSIHVPRIRLRWWKQVASSRDGRCGEIAAAWPY